MLKNYVKIALRNIMRNKVYSAINIFGLSLGVACCLLLAMYIQDEMSYDKHHAQKEDLYRIITQIHGKDGLDKIASCSPPIAMAMRDEIPEVQNAARLLNPPGVAQNLIKYENNTFYESDGFLGDSTIFDLLTYAFIEGSPAKALTEPNAVVITGTLAQKLFGKEPALNKVISISQSGPMRDFKITGVIEGNSKSFVKPNFIVSMMSSGWGEYVRSAEAQGEWAGQNFMPSYVKLVPGHVVEEVTKKMNEVLVKYGSEDMKALGLSKTLSLEPVQHIYLKSDIGRSPRITYIYIIASIAIFILLLACINFMNLSTAKATKRAAEIGIRKVLGAFRSSLISQILGEAFVLVMIAIVLSIVLLQLALPFFNELTDKSISFGAGNVGYFAAALLFISIITGLLAGSYPAFYLSSFQPAAVLKGKFSLNNTAGLLRQALVVFQFMIAIALVCGMFIIGKQLKFMEEQNLGFNPEAKVVLPLRTATAQENYPGLQKELSRNHNVISVSSARYMPGSIIWNDFALYESGSDMNNAKFHRVNTVDYGYLELLGIPIIAGRSFIDNRETEGQRKIIINRSSANAFGFTPEKAVGQNLYFEWQGEKMAFEVIGVMEDYHQTSLKEKIYPLVYQMPGAKQNLEYAILNINTHDVKATIRSIEKTWKTLIDDTPFEYSFLDENIHQQYLEDQKVSKIITSFTLIAMLISCLGLYGLSTYMAERRFKEIGVRKVMGASVNQIVGLMSKEFVRLVIIAFVISVPIAWYAMNKWLGGFAYKISIDAMVFLYAGAAALTIALLTVSFESLKAASTNPAKALRNE